MAHVIFNRSNIAKATWFSHDEIADITIKGNKEATVKVWTKNFTQSEEITVTVDEILQVMESVLASPDPRSADRRDRAETISIIPDRKNYCYLAINHLKETEYNLIPRFDYITCQCCDYKNQAIYLDRNNVCCKHIYSLLNFLKFKSLADYIESNQIDEEYDRELLRREYETLAYSDVDLHGIDY